MSNSGLSVELNDVLKALVENILNDFTENVSNGLLNLAVDSSLNINFGIINKDLSVIVVVRENSAVAILFDFKEIMGADRVAFTGFNVVLTFNFETSSTTSTVVGET